MADPRRQKIVDAVVERMKLIDGTGDYQTDIADRAEDSRMNWDEADLPAISVFDGDATQTAAGDPRKPAAYVHEMPVLIRGSLKAGDTAAAARKLIADIMTAIRVDDEWKVSGTPLVMLTQETRNSVTRSQDSFEVEGCEVEIKVLYILPKFNAIG